MSNRKFQRCDIVMVVEPGFEGCCLGAIGVVEKYLGDSWYYVRGTHGVRSREYGSTMEYETEHLELLERPAA